MIGGYTENKKNIEEIALQSQGKKNMSESISSFIYHDIKQHHQ